MNEFVYYESMKGNLKIKPIYECRCNGRLQTKRFMRLGHYVGGDERLKARVEESTCHPYTVVY
jgi:hypothetical protein